MISDLGTAVKAHWNADDTSDGAVASWTARIGGQTVTATAGLEPASAATSFNGVKRGLTFDGTNDELILAGTTGLPTGSTAGEIWAIVTDTSSATTRSIVRYGSAAAYRGLQKATGTPVRFATTDGAVALTDTAVNFVGYHIVGGYWSGTTAGGRLDGQDTNPATATISTPTTGTTRLRIGSITAAAPANWWQGVIRHVLITTLLTGTQREKLEGWLAHDSGLTSLLPGGHPYKLLPPRT
jgi:hypothetical protein